MPASAAAARLPPLELVERARPRACAVPSAASPTPPRPGRNASLTRTAPSGTRLRLAQPPVLDPHELNAAAAHVDAEAVLRRVVEFDDRQVAVPGLLGAADHAHLEARVRSSIARSSSSRLCGVADRAGGHGVHPLDARRLAGTTRTPRPCSPRARIGSGLSTPSSPMPALTRVGLADLVGQAPPATGLVLVDHQPERVRAHVDDRHSFHEVR